MIFLTIKDLILILVYVKPIIFTCVYRPPGSKVALFENIEALFSILDHEHFEFLVSGDFNCNEVNNTDNDTKHIKRIFSTFYCKQLITECTRVTWNSQTIIDHVITNKPEHTATSGVIPCGISDHDVTYAVRSLNLPKRKKLLKCVTFRKYNKFEVRAFLDDLKKFHLMILKNIAMILMECGKFGKTFSSQHLRSMRH